MRPEVMSGRRAVDAVTIGPASVADLHIRFGKDPGVTPFLTLFISARRQIGWGNQPPLAYSRCRAVFRSILRV